MKCLLPLSVFVFAVLAVQMTAEAQERQNSPSVTAAPAGGSMGYVPSRNSLEKFAQKRTGGPMMPQGAFNGYSAQRLSPDYGANGSGGQGFSHFPAPLSRYSNWYPRGLRRCSVNSDVSPMPSAPAVWALCLPNSATAIEWIISLTQSVMETRNTAPLTSPVSRTPAAKAIVCWNSKRISVRNVVLAAECLEDRI